MRRFTLHAVLWATVLLCGQAWAQEEAAAPERSFSDDEPGYQVALKASSPIGNDEVALREIYGDDPVFGVKVKLERHLGIYLLNTPQRDPNEKVTLSGKTVDASVWVSIGQRSEEQLACRAVRWLVLGRTQWSLGARGIFSELPDLRKLSLTLIHVRLRDKRNKKKGSEVVPYMSVSLNRRAFGKLDVPALRQALADGRCVEAARKHLTSYEFNSQYYAKYQDDRF